MTISKKLNWKSAVAVAAVATVVSGCGGGGGSLTSKLHSGIYVAGYNENRVRYFSDMTPSSAQVIATQDNLRPQCLAFDSTGRLYMGCTNTLQMKADKNATPVPYGTQGTGVGQFDQITGLAVDSQDRVYIADGPNKRIVRIDDITGAGWTSLDLTPYVGATDTSGMAIDLDSTDRFYITLRNSCKILRFDSLSDTTPDSYGAPGNGVGQFNGPVDVHISQDDKIYIAEYGNSRIVRIDDMSGTNWVSYGTFGSGVHNLNTPSGVATDSAGRIYIADQSNYRVMRIDNMSGLNWTSFGYFNDSNPFGFTSMWDILVR